MTRGVFLYREDSPYQDRPWEVYQFPSMYLTRAAEMVGDWVIFMEPVKAGRKGYHAVAKIDRIIPDQRSSGMYLALIDPTSYLDFDLNVPFQVQKRYPELSVLNQEGRVSGRAQAAVRLIPEADFNRIIALGIAVEDAQLPRVDIGLSPSLVADEQAPILFNQDHVKMLTLRTVRDRVFRRKVLLAYDNRCALTGLKFINGGGRAEVEAAHIKPVEFKGPDVVSNGLALSGTIHWMFDRGLLSLEGDHRIMVSSHINDTEGVKKILNADGFARFPEDLKQQPDSRFLAWHRETIFKGYSIEIN